MATKTKKRQPPKPQPVQHPASRDGRSLRAWLPFVALGAVLLIAVVIGFIVFGGSGRKQAVGVSAGLPKTPDYHSLLVDPSNPRKLILGTHYGLYLSDDGGQHWQAGGLSSDDAMN